jgi:hypothetical protein
MGIRKVTWIPACAGMTIEMLAGRLALSEAKPNAAGAAWMARSSRAMTGW